MRPLRHHSVLPGLFLAFISCLLVPPGGIFRPSGSLSLVAGLAHAIPAVAEITVRSQVVVNEKRLRLLDFCESEHLSGEWKTLLAGADLGLAPEIGRELTFKPRQIAQHLGRLLAAQGLDPNQTAIRLPDQISVSRQQISITREQIETYFKEFVLKKAPWKAEDLVFGSVSSGAPPVLPPGQLTVEVTASPHERFLGDVGLSLHFSIDGKEVRNMRVSGKVEVYQEVAHSVRAMKRDEVITETDVQFLRTSIAARPDRYLLQREQVIGKKLLSSIGPNQPLSPRDLDQPSLIKRGDPVTIVYRQDGIRLSTRGESRDKGGQGDRVRVRNLDSKKNIPCQVLDSQTVEVLP